MNLFEAALGVDLSMVIETYSDVHFDSTHNHNTHCPICNHGHNTGCFGLYGKTKGVLNRFKCFSCGAHGDAIDFVKTIKGLASRSDAAKDICNTFGLTFDAPKLPDGYVEYVAALDFCSTLFHYFLSVCPDPLYFRNRCIPQDIENEYSLGYCPSFFTDKSGKVVSFRSILESKGFDSKTIDGLGIVTKTGDCLLAGRYVFPITDGYGNVVAFSGRSLDPNLPKYLNSSETKFFRKSFSLFNFGVAKTYSTVYVVEGYFDALSLISIGIKNVVASMGTAFGSTHLKMLSGKRIILSLDNDDAGRRNIASIIEANRNIRFEVVESFEGKDFNELLCNGGNIVEALSSYEPGPLFLCHFLAHNLDLSSFEGRKELWVRMASLIGADNPQWYSQFPLNTIYTPFDLDYFWKKCVRYVKKRKEVIS